jgi:UDP-glucose 4-epimerase
MNYGSPMRILVTGGFGFIGSHLCERLVQEGYEVIVLDDNSTGREINLDSIKNSSYLKIIHGSILDIGLLKTISNRVDYIFHLAAAVGVFNIMNKPLDSLLVNIRGTENVLEAACSVKVPVFLTSSSEVYGKNISDSLLESDDRILGSPLTLRWSYSEAKAIDESLAYAYHVERGLETRIVRFFNTVGPRQLGSYGMVIPRFVEAAINNEQITIYGDGEQTRCFAHVHDVIDAILAVAFAKNTIGRVINIGNNTEISINDLAQKILSETCSNSKIVHIPYEQAYGDGFEDMERRVPNINLIKELVGWVPRRDLSTIVADIQAEMRKAPKEN